VPVHAVVILLNGKPQLPATTRLVPRLAALVARAGAATEDHSNPADPPWILLRISSGDDHIGSLTDPIRNDPADQMGVPG
jgi:hypothetical protein